VAAIFSTDSLARIRVPVGLVTAGHDTMLPTALHAGRVLRDCTACRPLADLPGAGHMDLLAPFPRAIAEAEAARQPRGGALQRGFNPAERDAAVQAVADFHRRHLGPWKPQAAANATSSCVRQAAFCAGVANAASKPLASSAQAWARPSCGRASKVAVKLALR